jgi:hypothetical protein
MKSRSRTLDLRAWTTLEEQGSPNYRGYACERFVVSSSLGMVSESNTRFIASIIGGGPHNKTLLSFKLAPPSGMYFSIIWLVTNPVPPVQLSGALFSTYCEKVDQAD